MDPADLRVAAAAVDAAADARAAAASTARDGWAGPARDDFDADVAALQREATHLAADLRTAAAVLVDAAPSPAPAGG